MNRGFQYLKKYFFKNKNVRTYVRTLIVSKFVRNTKTCYNLDENKHNLIFKIQICEIK